MPTDGQKVRHFLVPSRSTHPLTKITYNHLLTGKFRWQGDGVFVDMDGSLTGEPEARVLPTVGTLDPAKCTVDSRFGYDAASASVCVNSKFARLAFNK